MMNIAGYIEQNQESEEIQIKNEYSTFIEELEETTQKLMNEVFNSDYRPQIDEEKQLRKQKQMIKNQRNAKNIRKTQKNQKAKNKVWYDGHYYENQNSPEKYTSLGEGFQNFMMRNKKWNQHKQKNIENQRAQKIATQNKTLTHTPQILRGSRQELQPIYERALQLHSSKEKIKTLKRIEIKRKEQQQIDTYSFHPEINGSQKPRSIQQYLRDKDQWNKKKLQKRQFRKLQNDAGKYTECTFTPELVTQKYNKEIIKGKNEQALLSDSFRGKQRVQERLLRSLQKICVMQVEN